MRLKDVLDAVVKVADKPIEYSVEPYGVVFSLNPNQTGGIVSSYTVAPTEPPPLLVRTFKVDTNTFLTGLKRAFGAGFEPKENATADQIRSEFGAASAEPDFAGRGNSGNSHQALGARAALSRGDAQRAGRDESYP